MGKPEECEKTQLAAGPCARIESCSSCDVVSVHLGSVSLRFSASALASLHATIGEALVKLEVEAARPAYATSSSTRLD